MTDVNWDEVGKALLRSNVAINLEKAIKEPLKEVLTPLLTGEEIDFSACIDSILLSLFTHIDLLGYLYTGDSSSRNSSKNAVQFIRNYLGKIDARYKEVGGLLYHALRHGLVHLATPKRIQLKDGKILDFSFDGSGQRGDYLKISKTLEIQRTGERVDVYRLLINLHLLYEDLLSAMDIYAEEIRNNQAVSDVFWKAFESRRKPEKEKEEELLNKRHIQESDFAFVRDQISKL